ncbi:MAG: methyltransferase domain-containing protein [Anaerolineae bacterium]|nr:methyltransferase domain-containing protein [Anaerolineae bacterium]
MNQDTRQRAYFDRFAEQFRAADYLSPDLATRTELASFFRFLDLPPSARVLEVGCGTGRYALPLLPQGHTVTGVDVSPNSLRLLQSLAERAGVADRLFTVESALERPLFEAEFDAAFGINILHHVTNMPAFCANVIGAVRPGGCIAFMEPNPYNPFFYPAYVLNGTWHLEKGFLRCSPAKLRALFTHLGLRNVEIRRYSLIPTRLARLWPGVLNLNTTLIRSLRLRRLAAFTQVRGEKP